MAGGASTRVAARPKDGARFELGRLLTCDSCDQFLQPLWSPRGVRKYTFLCGCRRDSIDAHLVERLVRDRVETASALLVADVAAEGLGVVFRGLFVAVRIGHCAEDLKFAWRV
jgi:hypothetical protein